MSLPTVAGTLDAFRFGVNKLVCVLVNRLALLTANVLKGTPVVAIATTTTKVKTTATAGYAIDGAPKSLAATDNFWTLAGTVLIVGQTNKYLLYVDAAGAASVVEGTPATGTPVLPFPAQGKCCFGVVAVTCVSAGFTPGTTALNAAGLTVTFTDGPPPDWFALIADRETNAVISAQ